MTQHNTKRKTAHYTLYPLDGVARKGRKKRTYLITPRRKSLIKNAVKTAINRIGNGLSNANERCFFTQK